MIIAGIVIAVGLILFAVVMSLNKWDFTKLGTVQYETNAHELSEDFQNISIDTDTAHVSFCVSDDGKCRVICHEAEKRKHTVAVENGVLTVKIADERAWYEMIGFSFDSPFITIYLPKHAYNALTVYTFTGDVTVSKDFTFGSIEMSTGTGDVKNYASAEAVKLNATTGDIYVEGITANTLELSVSTGEVTVVDSTCKGSVTVGVSTGNTELINVQCCTLISTGSTGYVSLRDVIAQEMLSIERSTGDVHLERCDGGEIYIKTNTGSVKGGLLTGKDFVANTSTGHVDVPDSTVGAGSCKIVTTTGNIKIFID